MEFKQNNPQTTLTSLNFNVKKVGFYLNSTILLNKIPQKANFGHCPLLPPRQNMKNNGNALEIHQKNDFLKSHKIAQL